ncbi:MAG TPA: TRAP transporter substrate-binding protein [Xanthobacteraceae bacterium]|jgi:TRAP-type C4-dicarboxylate transport system substrate-binding protein|nr:TRAP transporter substrate-binding protein [Xanthobacteraceae bacterium]
MTARRAMLAAAIMALTPLSIPSAQAADFVMKAGCATINEGQHQFLKFLKEDLEKASGGRIEVQVYPASQLGPIPREIEGVQLGSIQVYIGPVDFFVGVDPRFGVFSAPMVFRDDVNAAATVADPDMRKAMFDLVAPKRMVGIATLNLGAADYGAKKSIMRLADFSGKKLRINGTELERQKMAKLGATGIGMPLSEVVPALDQGTIDGTISGLSVFVAFKMNDLVKVITVTNDTFINSIAVVSKTWLDTLPPDLQKIVTDTAAADATKTQQWEFDFNKKLESDWSALGGTVVKLPAEDLAQMKTLLDPVADDATKDQPAVRDMLKMVRAAAAKH